MTGWIFGILSFLIGYQIWLGDLRLLTGRYHYRIQTGNTVSFLALTIAGWLLYLDVLDTFYASFFLYAIVGVFGMFVAEFIISRLNLQSAIAVWGLRILYASMLAIICNYTFPLIMVGIALRQSPFGIPYVKTMALANCFPRIRRYYNHQFSYEPFYAGARGMHDNNNLPRYNVTEYGIHPDQKDDLTLAVQRLIDQIGNQGGGTLYFPKGRYLFRNVEQRFLQINHSHITLEGECDAQGHPLTELVSGIQTASGTRNPWLSPFFITTGEAIQPSNIFFGLQFRKFKEVVLQSSSLSDPGSDGKILTPDIVTKITASVRKGAVLVHVEDARSVGRYIMIGLFNTSPDGNLLKDILGIQKFRSEWTAALRAGDEEAPSYQWLVEVARVVDDTTIELVRPALRDLDMCYTPAIYNVEMLEDINLRNLKINSLWNGQFHHHGFPLYYSVNRSQEMDYGWNAINMKRVAHGAIYNVEIRNFTNPLYLLDSRNISVSHLRICGHDGHQGIKLYQHACDNLIKDVVFTAHFADMMGGEGNAYGNVFYDIHYLNPVFKPVDFDFHGFSEGPMSPPSDNIFGHIRGFRYIKSAGARHMLPGCAQRNVWIDIETEGERRGDILFLDLSYRPKRGLIRIITAVGYAIVMAKKQRVKSVTSVWRIFNKKLRTIDDSAIPIREHYRVFPHSILRDVNTWADLKAIDPTLIDIQS